MKIEKIALLSAIGGLVLLAAITYRLWSPVAWEYAIVSPPDYELSARLTQLGSEGWEIASARRALDDKSGVYEIILKRPVGLWHRKSAPPAPIVTTGESLPSPSSYTPPASTPSYTYTPPAKAAPPPAISYPAPDDPRAKVLLRACVDGKVVALKDGKWEPYAISGTKLQCVVEQ